MGNFFIIPVPIIKSLFTDTDAYNLLLHVGDFISARKSSNYEDDEVIRHLTYCYFRKKHELTSDLVRVLEYYYDEGELEDDTYLFTSDACLNEEEIYFGDEANFEGIEEEQEGEPYTPLGLIANAYRKDKDIREYAKEWHDVYQFVETCNLNITGAGISETIRLGSKYNYSNQPYAMIDPLFFIKYRDKNKTERARAEFAMLLAISSIVGEKGWAATTRNLIIARMFGAKNSEGLEDALKGSSQKEGQLLKEAFEKYTTRRLFESMRDKLISKGLIKCWTPYSHRVFVSTSHRLEEIENDIMVFLKRKQSPKEQMKQDTTRLKELLNTS